MDTQKSRARKSLNEKYSTAKLLNKTEKTFFQKDCSKLSAPKLSRHP